MAGAYFARGAAYESHHRHRAVEPGGGGRGSVLRRKKREKRCKTYHPSSAHLGVLPSGGRNQVAERGLARRSVLRLCMLLDLGLGIGGLLGLLAVGPRLVALGLGLRAR